MAMKILAVSMTSDGVTVVVQTGKFGTLEGREPVNVSAAELAGKSAGSGDPANGAALTLALAKAWTEENLSRCKLEFDRWAATARVNGYDNGLGVAKVEQTIRTLDQYLVGQNKVILAQRLHTSIVGLTGKANQ